MKKKPLKEDLICISCPMGCNLEVTYDDKKIIEVKGNTCKRGVQYAETEIFHPERIVTTTVRVLGAAIGFIPVKTEKTVPKELTFDVVKRACKVSLRAPVKVGDVVVKNILGTGVNLIATRSLASLLKKPKKAPKKKPAAKLQKKTVKKAKKSRRKKRNA